MPGGFSSSKDLLLNAIFRCNWSHYRAQYITGSNYPPNYRGETKFGPWSPATCGGCQEGGAEVRGQLRQQQSRHRQHRGLCRPPLQHLDETGEVRGVKTCNRLNPIFLHSCEKKAHMTLYYTHFLYYKANPSIYYITIFITLQYWECQHSALTCSLCTKYIWLEN